VTEGTEIAILGLGVWERVTYVRTDSVVRSVVTDGRIYEPGGTFEFRVEPHGGGSRISVGYDRPNPFTPTRTVTPCPPRLHPSHGSRV
jgi:hypothetical protein